MRFGPVDFAIVTALKVERDAVLRRLLPVDTFQDERDPHTYYLARLDIPGARHYSVVLTMLLEPGNPSAAASTTRLIQRWHPKYVVVIGIAGGVAGRVALGDVVVADFCYAYEQSKRTPGADELRGQQLATDRFLYGRTLAYEDVQWREAIGVAPPAPSPGASPAVHFGPLASGEKVIADWDTLPQLITRVPKLLAIEMEGAGVGMALSQHMPAPGFFEIRGISDFANAQKNDDWHVYAANAAAAFALGLLQTGPVRPTSSPVTARSGGDSGMQPELAGTGGRIGRYRIVRELGQGGMATVFLAHDPNMDRQVAVKVLPRQFTHDPQFRVRFQREANIIAALEHPCIVPIYDYGEIDDQPYLVMRYMTGGTLAERLSTGPMPLADVAAVIRRLADALDAAHQKGIIHRDVKPSNVLFGGRGNATLSDFGLAKLLNTTPAASESLFRVGTPAYMSPEQAQGEKGLDHRTDIYSLGVILYEMLTGHHPYQADTPTGMMLKHITEPIPSVLSPQFGLPTECNAVIIRAMAKKPDERYETAGALAEAVSELAKAARQSSQPGVLSRETSMPDAVIPDRGPATNSAPGGGVAAPVTREGAAKSPQAKRAPTGSLGRLYPVASGPFIMGSRYHTRESPPRRLHLPHFEMAHVPVTSSQFSDFLDAGAYEHEHWWSTIGWAWRQGRVNGWGRADRTQPVGWPAQSSRPSHPVTGVTWYEAEAYCSWLSAQMERIVRLPTEAEWEKAARGTDGRLWPWGDNFESRRANTQEYGAGDTKPTGEVAGDVSPYKLRDMGGNVQEWTSSFYDPKPGEHFPGADLRVARGGSWNDTAFGARTSYRHIYPPGYNFAFLGFRILVVRR